MKMAAGPPEAGAGDLRWPWAGSTWRPPLLGAQAPGFSQDSGGRGRGWGVPWSQPEQGLAVAPDSRCSNCATRKGKQS